MKTAVKKPIRLYPVVAVKGQSFKGNKIHVLPNQSMTLQEIIKRFIRNESLPISKEGIYEERMGDLEKLANKDITEQMERVEDLKRKFEAHEKREKKKLDESKGRLGPSSDEVVADTKNTTQTQAKSAGGSQGGGESPPELKK